MTTLLMATADRPRAQGSFAPSFPKHLTEREREHERYAWIMREFKQRAAANPSANRPRLARDMAALAFLISLSDLQGTSRKADLVEKRKKVACVMQVLTGAKQALIARMLCRDRAHIFRALQQYGAEVRAHFALEENAEVHATFAEGEH